MAEAAGQFELRVVRATPAYAVVDKPPGLLSVPGKGSEKADCVAARVAAMFPGAAGPLVVHRLDMDTSGLLVLGLTARAQRELSRQFEERRVEKRYVALVEGMVEREEGVIELPVRPDVGNRPWQIVDHAFGRGAVTRWRVLAYETDRTRVEFEPLTGRAHQLRVHAATPGSLGGLGHAIVGDVLYGTGYRGPGEAERGRMVAGARLMLHASRLGFFEPGTQTRVEFESGAGF